MIFFILVFLIIKNYLLTSIKNKSYNFYGMNKHKNILSTGTYKENALTLQDIFPLFNKVE